jgi:hypothetical protein
MYGFNCRQYDNLPVRSQAILNWTAEETRWSALNHVKDYPIRTFAS